MAFAVRWCFTILSIPIITSDGNHKFNFMAVTVLVFALSDIFVHLFKKQKTWSLGFRLQCLGFHDFLQSLVFCLPVVLSKTIATKCSTLKGKCSYFIFIFKLSTVLSFIANELIRWGWLTLQTYWYTQVSMTGGPKVRGKNKWRVNQAVSQSPLLIRVTC